jgi:hypothetical protein
MGSKRSAGIKTPKNQKPEKGYTNPACVQVVADKARADRDAREKRFKKSKKAKK